MVNLNAEIFLYDLKTLLNFTLPGSYLVIKKYIFIKDYQYTRSFLIKYPLYIK
ncbi:hypothetical protein GILI108418_02110 [Gillisia limnaea]|uniref:Uncharacterized protein n=1 Tax=Gillisia limnaea (strain DSM 15749 / LMG 21470 / R-8282) TaxID=865937 RepID=H2BYH3_GILLR|nr:hypothetical protein Gilli_2698 [Gillisia limnaea DSM 15749]